MHDRKEGFMRKGLVALFFAVMLLFALASAGVVRATDNFAYELATDLSFGTVDLTTGAYTQINSLPLGLSGLGVMNGAIYGGELEGSMLCSVNPTTGLLTGIASGTLNYGITGSTLTGLYALNSSGSDLYSVNPSTGATTLIGPTGITFASYTGLSTNSSALYLTTGYNLYTLNTTTGAATLVGSGSTLTAAVGALVTEGGVLYAGDISNRIDTLDPTTGILTIGAAQTNSPGGAWGLTPDPLPASAVPLPSALLLFGPGLLGLAAIRRRFKK
jgi:hypothetical protein